MDINNYLRQKKELVDDFLERYLPSPNEHPPIIHEAMRYSITAGGKRLRSILCLAAYEASGGKDSAILTLAASLELVHTYSLIHDDLPAMDNDELRRGKPTNHKVYGEAIAILTGDALLTLAFEWLSNPQFTRSLEYQVTVRIIYELAQAAGSSGMIGGQVADLKSQGEKINPRELEYIHANKTGRLIRASVRVGALAARSSAMSLAALTSYGEKVGLAFQIMDDVLNVEGEKDFLGKSTGSDAAAKKATYPKMLGLEESRRQARELIKQAVGALGTFGSKASRLQELAKYVISRRR